MEIRLQEYHGQIINIMIYIHLLLHQKDIKQEMQLMKHGDGIVIALALWILLSHGSYGVASTTTLRVPGSFLWAAATVTVSATTVSVSPSSRKAFSFIHRRKGGRPIRLRNEDVKFEGVSQRN